MRFISLCYASPDTVVLIDMVGEGVHSADATHLRLYKIIGELVQGLSS